MTIKYKVFAAGQVLTAADLNNYLMNQVSAQADLVSELSSVNAGVKVAWVGGDLYVRNAAGAFVRNQARKTFAHLRQSSVQTLPDTGTNGWVNVILETEEVDTDNGHNPAGFPDRYYIPVTGYYRLSGGVGFDANNSGIRGARFAKNNNTIITGSAQTSQPLLGVPTILSARTVITYLTAGDFVSLQAVQASGGNLNCSLGIAGDASTMTIELVQAT